MTDAELHQYLSSLVRYIPETGEFFSLYTWELKKTAKCRNGYLRIQIGCLRYKAHRLAWFLTHGYWPPLLDHINRIRADNRLCNLREATLSENARNRAQASTRHICFDKNGLRRKRYLVKVRDLNGKIRNFGRFMTEAEAQTQAQLARDKLGIV